MSRKIRGDRKYFGSALISVPSGGTKRHQTSRTEKSAAPSPLKQPPSHAASRTVGKNSSRTDYSEPAVSGHQ